MAEHALVVLIIKPVIPPDTPDTQDPVLQLIGASESNRPLIDGIPVSEDPDLYLVADMMGEQAGELHAWEITPQRYRRGKDGEAFRTAEEKSAE